MNNKRILRLAALALLLTATAVGSLQLFAAPKGGCINSCMARGGSFGQCRSVCGL